MLRRSQTRAAQNQSLTVVQRHTRTCPISSTSTDTTPNRSLEDVVDLTCEDTNDVNLYIDLTSLDTTAVIIMDTPPATTASRRHRRVRPNGSDVPSTRVTSESPMLLSDSSDIDEDEDLPPLPFQVSQRTTSSPTTGAGTPSSGIVCPICLDGVNDIKANGRHLMATTCGHVFCSECIRGILASRDGGRRCPSCRKQLTARAVHQLFI